MGIRMQERDVFVVVNYDFEYITEEGKEVWMKEGEILLLLSRTNNDWWQVSGDLNLFVLLHINFYTALRENSLWSITSCQRFNSQ